MQDRACHLDFGLREKASALWQRQRAEQAVRSVFGRLNCLENVTAANSLSAMSRMGKLIEVISNATELKAQEAKFRTKL
ncbi:hypothetical protein NKW55_15815 [Gluconobacter kondonii]|nr:hypothetical protein [Gluconobacter kondonii]MCP1238005.1 hypothetical protein [Gluconobacter kondonii]